MGKDDDRKPAAARHHAELPANVEAALERASQVHWLTVPDPISRKDYEAELLALQIELVRMQNWVRETGQRVVIILEGRDSAGKGGTIRVLLEHLNPRFAFHVALPTPTEREKAQWFFQRYIFHLPTAGEIAFFDRSWYNRSGVEKVMGFTNAEQIARFLRQAPEFENWLVDEGFCLFKIWLEINPDEQIRRLIARAVDPLKQWKLSPLDLRAPELWDAYTDAAMDTFVATDTAAARWWLVNNNVKKVGRLNVARLLLHHLPYPEKDTAVVRPPDRGVVAEARRFFPLLSADGRTLPRTTPIDLETL